MGVRYLNRLIQEKSIGSVKRIHFEDLRGKKIAVDISIYMYRFLADGALLENMYLLASIFRYYDINAIFVFDGPPPVQKTDVIEIRKKKKDAAKKQYASMEMILRKKKMEPRIDNTEILEIEETMTQLKKQFIHIRDIDIINVKDLLVSFGFTIVDAEGEADALCAKLAIKRRVFACMSDDTDMFVYGCPIVLRHVSLLNHSAVSYNMADILADMKITQHEFKMMCVVNGTDYNVPTNPPTENDTMKNRIFTIYEQLIEFKKLGEKERKKYESGFYEWLETKKKSNMSVIALLENETMFDLSKSGSSDHYKQLVVLNRKDINKSRIVEIMMKEDFIFIESKPDDHKIISALSRGSGTITSSPIYGVGPWDANANSPSSGLSVSCAASRRATITDATAVLDAKAAVNAVECSDISSVDITQECKAAILATEVYGVEANSLHELKQKINRSKPIHIRRKKFDDE